MNNKKKLWFFIGFLIVIVGGGFLLSMLIPRNSIKKTGYKTKMNPNYIEDKMQEKKDSLKKQKH